jgi:disulfide bond formation protein DsbB
MSTAPAPASPPAQPLTPFYAWAAVALAGAASLGGLYLNLAEGKIPCPLCFYQRSFAYATLAVMLAGLLGKFNERVAVSALALPLAFAGLGVALFHVNLERTGVLECPSGMFGLSTAPKQSAILFGLLSAALVLDAYQPGRIGSSYLHVIGGAAAGILVAVACCSGNPKPTVPTKPYPEDEPIRVCRPPYVAKE